MLTRLHLRNIVLIKEAELRFTKGLTVLSGETGAGKSILLDALGLVIGKRAEARLVRAGEDKAYVSAEFDITGNDALIAWLDEQGMEVDNTLIIRRQIMLDGSSKAHVNDQPVTLKLLKMLGEMLVEIHGQHGQKGLLDAQNHQQFLDAYAGNAELLQDIAAAYKVWKKARDAIAVLEAELEQAERERDYLQHVLKELDALAPEAGEEEQLVEQRTALMQAEKSGKLLQEVSATLNGAQPVVELIRRAQTSLVRSAVGEGKEGQQIIDGLERALNEIADAECSLEVLIREDGYDEQALDAVEDRLFALREAARKHRTSLDGLVDIWHSAKGKIASLESSTDQLAVLRKQQDAASIHYQQTASDLRVKRLAAVEKLQDAIHAELAPLKMEATRFRVLCDEKPQAGWSARGADEICFEVSTNPGSPFGALSDIASGGELSRFMLALAVVLGSGEHRPVMIFDEIDTGTGGAVADAIGARLKALAAHAQVCVVTHLPQVAAQGQAHYFIEKHVVDDATVTQVSALDGQARHEELARMLSGAEVTDEARKAAGRLLGVG